MSSSPLPTRIQGLKVLGPKENGDSRFVALWNGDVVHRTRFREHQFSIECYLKEKVVIGSDCGYLYDVFTKEKYRGRGIAKAVTEYACRYLHREEGFKHLYALVRPDNLLSLHVFRKCGFQVVREIKSFKLLWLKQCRLSPTSQSLSDDDARARLNVDLKLTHE